MQVHPSQINPSEPFDVFYFIRNHTDASTYYVQAKVYDVRTGELLSTHNLTQSATNDRLFIKTIDAPGDPVGQGRNIVSIATVYTDSGYTTKSANYEEQEQYFLIRTASPIVLGGGGGADYDRIRDVVSEELEKRKPKPVEVPALPDMPFDAIFKTLSNIDKTLQSVPKKEAPSLTPLVDTVTALQQSIEDIKSRREFEDTDLTPVIEQVDLLAELVGQFERSMRAAHSVLLTEMENTLNSLRPTLLEAVREGITQALPYGSNLSLPVGGPQQPSTQPNPDMSFLMK